MARVGSSCRCWLPHRHASFPNSRTRIIPNQSKPSSLPLTRAPALPCLAMGGLGCVVVGWKACDCSKIMPHPAVHVCRAWRRCYFTSSWMCIITNPCPAGWLLFRHLSCLALPFLSFELSNVHHSSWLCLSFPTLLESFITQNTTSHGSVTVVITSLLSTGFLVPRKGGSDYGGGSSYLFGSYEYWYNAGCSAS